MKKSVYIFTTIAIAILVIGFASGTVEKPAVLTELINKVTGEKQ